MDKWEVTQQLTSFVTAKIDRNVQVTKIKKSLSD